MLLQWPHQQKPNRHGKAHRGQSTPTRLGIQPMHISQIRPRPKPNHRGSRAIGHQMQGQHPRKAGQAPDGKLPAQGFPQAFWLACGGGLMRRIILYQPPPSQRGKPCEQG